MPSTRKESKTEVLLPTSWILNEGPHKEWPVQHRQLAQGWCRHGEWWDADEGLQAPQCLCPAGSEPLGPASSTPRSATGQGRVFHPMHPQLCVSPFSLLSAHAHLSLSGAGGCKPISQAPVPPAALPLGEPARMWGGS